MILSARFFKIKISKRASIFLLLTLALSNVYAQNSFVVKGVLIDKAANIRVALATITNLNTGAAVGTNDMGFFSITANIGDTILVEKQRYQDVKAVVQNTRDLVLYLNAATTLNEVVITGKTKKQALDEIKQDFKNKGSYYGGKPPLGLLLPFGGSPLTFLYELFGKTPKQAKRFNRMYKNEMQNGEVDLFFNKALINKHTGLTGAQLDEFMINYRPTFAQAKTWTSYDGIKWINDSYKKYKDSIN